MPTRAGRSVRFHHFTRRAAIWTVTLGCLSGCLLYPAPLTAAKPSPVIVTLGEPSVWSLEQAHYLLARMREENLGLETSRPGPEKLDPSAVHGTRFRALQSFFGLDAAYDQPLARTQRFNLDAFQAGRARKHELESRLTTESERRLVVVRELGQAQVEAVTLPEEDPARPALEARIAALEAEKTLLDASIEREQNELAAIGDPQLTPALSGPTLGDPAASLERLTPDALTQAINDLEDPALHASTVLDNYIGMQYEIIAKQLTLLRDEVGPNRRLIFLELPQSFYTVPVRANRHTARVEWQITKLCLMSDAKKGAIHKAMTNSGTDAQEPPPLDPEILELICEKDEPILGPDEQGGGPESSGSEGRPSEFWKEYAERFRRADPSQDTGSLWVSVVAPPPDGLSAAGAPEPSTPDRKGPSASALVVDLIPRQSSLNVNQIHQTVKGLRLSGRLATIFGLGAKADFERQKEHFEQFLHQDTFASGFGKGTSRFGWDFGPLPGSKRISPGLRTTHAVVVVPRDTVAIEVRAVGFGVPFKQHPSKWQRNRFTRFFVPIPQADESFYLTDVRYTPVRSGEWTLVELEGYNFSPQIGVLVNGVPLRRTVALARPELANRYPATLPLPQGEVDGRFELVHSGKLVLSFRMDPSYTGTPVISLVTPQKAMAINRFKIRINDKGKGQLAGLSGTEPMFLAPLRIDRLAVNPRPGTCGALSGVPAVLHGTGFHSQKGKPAEVLVDNEAVARVDFVSTERLDLCLAHKPHGETIQMMVSHSNSQRAETARVTFPNPWRPRVRTHEIVRYDTSKSVEMEAVIGVTGDDPSGMSVSALGTGDPVPCDGTRPSTSDPALECRRLSGEKLWVRLHSSDGTDQPVNLAVQWSSGDISVVTLAPPVRPEIEKIFGQQGKPEGWTTGGYKVSIQGRHLGAVSRVYFGLTAARILLSGPTRLEVLAPPGGTGEVQVELLTGLTFLGRPVTNAHQLGDAATAFTYKKKPKS